MKIAFIDPCGPVSGISAGLGYLSAVAFLAGHQVRVIDFNNDPAGEEGRLSELDAWEPDVIGFTVKSSTVYTARALAERLARPGRRLVAGGPGVTCDREGFLRDHPIFDHCFCGEAEDGFIHYLSALAGDGNIAEIPGWCTKADDGCRYNGTVLQPDLDTLPFPDYTAFDTVARLKDRYPLVTSRGCPYDCVYCSVNKVSGRKWRSRSAENVIAELAEAKKKYGIVHFDIADDNFTMDIGRAKAICRGIIREGLNLSWSCLNGIRADRVDEELLALMKHSGCDVIWFGIESMSEPVFDGIRKGEPLAAVRRAVLMAKAAGMGVCGFFVAGLPGSTYRTDQESLRAARELGLDEMLWSLATPYPHTELKGWAEKNATILHDHRGISFFKRPRAAMETPQYPAADRLKMFYKGNLSGGSYACFFGKRITPGDFAFFVMSVLRHDALNVFTHMRRIFFGSYHRKYLKEVLRRLGLGGRK